ncbi:LysR family transcriptional regulator [Marichromatium purpuratum 984]|uniref:LysR family transcriptional regulator n=1 Tax=Marichromatium purpuratum 984 TaxID=765910 RepID=W0E1G6_MARPU|nr:LysR family transcriptional regulator [Marichromatium purpuratum]AHF02956.1 LysR family transcriptional regulator [Marichromatium purpuratum 984]
MNLRDLDLNLLVVLHQLLEERHVSRAAEQLGMSQPAVSRALGRLRALFDDPLLVRTAGGYVPSTRAEQLLPGLRQLLSDTERLVSGPDFDPASASRTVRCYGPEPEIGWFLPPLFARLSRLAPGMVLEIHSEPREHFGQLERGDVHFVLSTFSPDAATGELHSTPLAPLSLALLMRADHPLAEGELTIERYISARHGRVSLTSRGEGLLTRTLVEQGLLAPGERLQEPLRLSSFSAIAAFCEHSDIVFQLPRRFAETVSHGRALVVRDTPFDDLEHPLVHLYWHERTHRDPMCVWVRQQLRIAHGLAPEPTP